MIATSLRRCAGLAAAMFLLWLGEALAEPRVALVVGNSAYQHAGRLPNPVNDAKSMAELFKKAGFDVVETRTDIGNLDLKRAIREFTETAKGADIAVVYFAGHGIEIGGINYLIPVDARLAKDLDAEDEAVPLDRLIRALEPARRLRLVILDACRDNPFLITIQRTMTMRAVVNGLAKIEPTSSDTLIAYAAKAGSIADDGTGSNSPFTAALLNHIAEPGLDIRLALGRVRDEVLKGTRNKQEPFVYGSLGGTSISLVPAPIETKQPVIADVRRDYELAERVGTKDSWQSFLRTYPAGFYSDLARAQLAKLERAEREQAERARATNRDQIERDRQQTASEMPRANATGTEDKDQPASVQQTRPGSPPPDTKTVLLAPQTEPRPPPPQSSLSGRALVGDIQKELKRVGCYAGRANGEWETESTTLAVKEFARSTKLSMAYDHPTLELLAALRARLERACPLTCTVRQVEKGGQCVTKVCPGGKHLDTDGRCVAEAPKPRTHRTESRAQSARPGGRRCFVSRDQTFCE